LCLDIAQLHGKTRNAAVPLAPRRIIRALRIRDRASLAAAAGFEDASLLLDAYVEGRLGGTGRTFDWNLAACLTQKHRVVLAGGLTPENVAEAIRAVRPYAVDVSSGVESAPGRKDAEKMAAFIENARNV
jgi:phosphoribosylanthranilate isomerase